MDKPKYFEKPIFDIPRNSANEELFKSILDEEDVENERKDKADKADKASH